MGEPQAIPSLVRDAFAPVPALGEPPFGPAADWPRLAAAAPAWALLNRLRDERRAELVRRGWLTAAELEALPAAEALTVALRRARGVAADHVAGAPTLRPDGVPASARSG